MAKPKKTAVPAKRATSATTKKPAGSKVIQLCVLFAQAKGAWNEGYVVDTSDCECAAKLGEAHRKAANDILHKLARLPATIPAELISKARIIPMFDILHLTPGNDEIHFIEGFAKDVEKLLRPQLRPSPD
jgi:hypothetical protein